MERITSQKQIIAYYLKSVRTHPTAQEIHSAIKNRLPRISRATIYRNLNLMKEKGEIREIDGETKRYDAFTSPHSHFICQKCGGVSDVFEKINLKFNGIKAGKIKNYQIYFYGLCNKCHNKGRRQ